jgi:DMSO/TMAO reductase YedYZ molybdopterin-dependent catalytic subunit
VPLVGGSLFQLWTGAANIDLWYPLPFYFPAAHHWVAWVTVGALVVHVGAKVGVARRALALPGAGGSVATAERRRFLAAAGGAGGLLVAVTAGMTVRSLERLALLAPRRPSIGPQGLPVNGAAAEAGVVVAATDPGWALEVIGRVARPRRWTLAELRALSQHEAVLPIACVEGWSASARWRGPRLRDLLDLSGAPEDAAVTVRSVEQGLYARSDVNGVQARDADTLLALDVNGEPLHLDHGYPCRLIGPGRPGVMQTKWLRAVEVR